VHWVDKVLPAGSATEVVDRAGHFLHSSYPNASAN
jgi:hypothetical protein